MKEIGVSNGSFLELPYPPSANKYWRNLRGRMVKSDEARMFIQSVKVQCMVKRIKPILGDVSVRVKLHPRTTKSGKASNTRLDCDNALKVCLDSLNGFAYIDDKQVVEIYACIAEPKPNGGVSVFWSGR